MNIIEKNIRDLIPYENNPRNNDKAVEAVAASIKEFGFKVPIVIDKNNIIVAGHTRHLAAKKLGLEKAPCIVADDLTEEQVKAFRLADNKTAELAEWDFEKLELEMMQIETIPLEQFGFGNDSLNEWFNREDRNNTGREEGNDEYNEFLDKFEDPKTTDDCYTPDNIYEAVAGWVAKEYKVKRLQMVRPFYPGGDFEKYDYKPGDVVVDNPPFSILAKIYDFYIQKGVKFFLFAPSMTSLKSAATRELCAIYPQDCDILYENGAEVPTAFVTNLQPGIITRTAKDLGAAIKEANEVNKAAQSRSLPKYKYPDQVLTAAQVAYISKYGQNLEIKAESAAPISELDAMKEFGKGIYGGGLLLSEKAAAEKAAAEKAAAEKAAAEKAAATVWELSEREWEIVHSLGGGEDE